MGRYEIKEKKFVLFYCGLDWIYIACKWKYEWLPLTLYLEWPSWFVKLLRDGDFFSLLRSRWLSAREIRCRAKSESELDTLGNPFLPTVGFFFAEYMDYRVEHINPLNLIVYRHQKQFVFTLNWIVTRLT